MDDLQGKKLRVIALACGIPLILFIAYQLFVAQTRTPTVSAPLPQEAETKPLQNPAEVGKPKATYVGQDRRRTDQIPKATKEDAPPMTQNGTQPYGPTYTPANDARTSHGSTQSQTSAQTAAKSSALPKAKPSKHVFATMETAPEPGASTSAASEQPGASGGADRGKSSLIRDAGWEVPARPERVWYMSQALRGTTRDLLNSDHPGQIVVIVTQPLMPKDFSSDEPLIPQHAKVVLRQEGKPDFGNPVLKVVVKQIETDGGAIIPMQGELSDKYGAAGLHGNVDYHIPQLITAALISATLSIATTVPTGNTEGFVPTIGQQASRQLGSDINRTGSEIVRRQLAVPPTVTEDAGTPVLLYPDTNISFSRPAKVIK